MIELIKDLGTRQMIKEIESGIGFGLKTSKALTRIDERRVRERVGKELLKEYGLD